MSSSSNFKTPLPMGEGLGVRLLKQYWGYDTFRGIQEDIINSITEGRDFGTNAHGRRKIHHFPSSGTC